MSRLRIAIVSASALLMAGCTSSGSPAAGVTPPPAVSPTGASTGSPAVSPSASPTVSSPVSSPASPATPPAAGGGTLPTGKDDLPLGAGTWRSPAGFAPVVSLKLPAGWTSVHRGADAFDIGRPDPTRDAPLVAIVFLTPKQATAADALTDVKNRANGDVEPTAGTIGGVHGDAVDVTGGSGQLVASRSGGIALDAADGQRVRLLALTVHGAPLIVAVLVAQSAQWDAVWPDLQAVLAGVKFG